MIPRTADKAILSEYISSFPVTAIVGPRQTGKTTLAREFSADHYFDLENPRDTVLLAEPQLALESLTGLVVIDEIQRAPNIFPLIRHLVDTNPSQRYLILGSASRDLLRQSAESLAGRIAYHELGGFSLGDVGKEQWRRLWLRGGLPRSFIADTDHMANQWQQQYIATFLERDIPQLGISIPPATLRRFWTMLCHYHGQVINYAEFARSFGISDMTVRRYLDILSGTFMIRLLQPWSTNAGKRVVKRPKIYFRDSGLFHALLAVRSAEDLATNNKLGASWEGFAVEAVARVIGKRNEELAFWATHAGAEVDLVWMEHGRTWAVEVKYADAPRLTRSMTNAVKDLQLAHLWVVYPGDRSYPLDRNITVLPLQAMTTTWNYD